MPRGAKPGERRGGRSKGTPNRTNSYVSDILAEMGCCPFRGMAEIAMNESYDPELRGSMLGKLAPYVAAQLKSIEVKTDPDAASAVSLVDLYMVARQILK